MSNQTQKSLNFGSQADKQRKQSKAISNNKVTLKSAIEVKVFSYTISDNKATFQSKKYSKNPFIGHETVKADQIVGSQSNDWAIEVDDLFTYKPRVISKAKQGR